MNCSPMLPTYDGDIILGNEQSQTIVMLTIVSRFLNSTVFSTVVLNSILHFKREDIQS